MPTPLCVSKSVTRQQGALGPFCLNKDALTYPANDRVGNREELLEMNQHLARTGSQPHF